VAELIWKEHLRPSLLDRLTGEEQVMSFRKLRQSVLRDLEWLLNAGNLESSQDLSDYPEVRSSVLNFGVPELTGKSASGTDGTALERALRQAICNFEPRILPDSLKIRVAVSDEELNRNAIVIEIEGELWMQPMPERLYLKTILDVELGKWEVKEMQG
jgi:type VI secretion system protein ImpF